MPLRHDRDVGDLADGLQQRTSIGTEVVGAVEVGKTVDATVLVVEDLLLYKTGISTTLSENCICEISKGVCTVKTMATCFEQHLACPRTATVESPWTSARSEQWAPVVAQQWACQQSCPRSAPVESPRASARWHLSLHNNGHDNNPVEDLQRSCTANDSHERAPVGPSADGHGPSVDGHGPSVDDDGPSVDDPFNQSSHL